jgi:hypothetical protein
VSHNPKLVPECRRRILDDLALKTGLVAQFNHLRN